MGGAPPESPGLTRGLRAVRYRPPAFRVINGVCRARIGQNTVMVEQMTGAADTEVDLLIADDHQLVRDLVASHLRAQGGFSVTTADSFAAAQQAIATQGGFDIVLLDFAMPGMKGVQGVADLVAANQGKPVVLFSGLARRETVMEALARGASGYIPKSTSAKSLPNAIRLVLSGEVYLPASFQSAPPPGAGDSGLSPRELEVLRAVRGGLMNKEIANRMGLSEVTIKMHVRSICTKLNARNRTQAAIMAESLGLD